MKDEKYKVSIDYKYDKDFISILLHEKLHKFQFSLDLETASLIEKKISPKFEELFLEHFGKTKVTISINPLDEHDSLDNNKIMNFFSLARDEGLISSVKISKKNSKQKNIESTSKGDILQYTTKTRNADNLDEAHNLFQSAIQKNFKLPS